MEVQRLELIAREVRQGFIDRTIDFSVIEKMYSESPFLKYYLYTIRGGVKDFPLNNCTAATLYLKHILGEGEVFHGKFLTNNVGKLRHDFLLLDDGNIVDITADQFKIDEHTQGPPIYIGPLKNPWLREPWM